MEQFIKINIPHNNLQILSGNFIVLLMFSSRNQKTFNFIKIRRKRK